MDAQIPPSIVTSPISADGARLQSVLSNAEAYKQGALVYLNRHIRASPRRSHLVQIHTKQALHACLRVVAFAGPMCALLWPLFISACEAVEEADRNSARTVFKLVKNQQ